MRSADVADKVSDLTRTQTCYSVAELLDETCGYQLVAEQKVDIGDDEDNDLLQIRLTDSRPLSCQLIGDVQGLHDVADSNLTLFSMNFSLANGDVDAILLTTFC